MLKSILSQSTDPFNGQTKYYFKIYTCDLSIYLPYITIYITIMFHLWTILFNFRSWCDGTSDRSFMVNLLNYLSFQPVLYDWCNKGHGMCYHVSGMVHIKEPLLLLGKISPCSCSGFPLLLSEWFFTILCLTPYNRK